MTTETPDIKTQLSSVSNNKTTMGTLCQNALDRIEELEKQLAEADKFFISGCTFHAGGGENPLQYISGGRRLSMVGWNCYGPMYNPSTNMMNDIRYQFLREKGGKSWHAIETSLLATGSLYDLMVDAAIKENQHG